MCMVPDGSPFHLPKGRWVCWQRGWKGWEARYHRRQSRHRLPGHRSIWGLYISTETIGSGGGFRRIGYHKGFAQAGFGDTVNQIAVDGASDSEGEEIGGADVPADDIEYLSFTGDIAIGNGDDAARCAGEAGMPSAVSGQEPVRYRRRLLHC